ncbi:MAG: hypothetical protein ACK4MV_11310 [Beijerinckiaceae bacterium]
MSSFTRDAAESLKGALDLMQRRADGLSRFDLSPAGFRRSFAAIPLAIPAFIALVAANRAQEGLLTPGAFLFADLGPVWRAAVDFACIWAAPLLVAFWVASILDLRRRFLALVVVMNWTGVIAACFLALPSLLFALGLARESHAYFYGFAFLALIAHLQWFTTKHALGVSGGVAATVIIGQLGLATVARAALV